MRLRGDDASDGAEGADLPPAALAIRRLTVEHRRRRLRAVPGYRRRTLVVVTAPDDVVLDRSVAAVFQSLQQTGVPAVLLGGAALRDCLCEAWGAAAGAGTDCTPPAWTRRRLTASVGSITVQAHALRRLPGTAVAPGWLAPLLLVNAACDIAMTIRPTTTDDALTRLHRRLRVMRADQLVEVERDRVADVGVQVGVENALDLRTRLARNEARPALMSLVAVARGDDEHDALRIGHRLRGAYTAALADSEPLHFRHLEAAASAWPLGDNWVGPAKLVDTAAAATCLPWVEATCDEAGGYDIGVAPPSESPVRIAPFDATRHANANIAVIAASGHGKSYAIGSIILQAAARGVESIVIDPEGEYEEVVRALDGEYVRLAPGTPHALNIFDAAAATAGADRQGEVVGAVVDLVDVLCGGHLDQVERAHVDAAATRAMANAAAAGRPALLADCLAGLDQGRVATVVRRFCEGPLGELFNRPTSLRLDAPVVGFTLRDLKPELIAPTTLVVAEWLWAVIRRSPRPRHLIFDEVGLLCAHGALRTLLVQLARRCRKYGASLVVATQNVSDLLSTDEGRVIATNPAIVLLGGHRGAETVRMETAFNLQPSQRRFLEASTRGEFLLLADPARLAIRVETAPALHRLLTTRRPAAG